MAPFESRWQFQWRFVRAAEDILQFGRIDRSCAEGLKKVRILEDILRRGRDVRRELLGIDGLRRKVRDEPSMVEVTGRMTSLLGTGTARTRQSD
jgi:hypothetical protein